MSQESSKIKYPNCDEEIDVNEILYHQLDNELKQKHLKESAAERKKYEDKEEKLQNKIAAVEKKNEEYEDKLTQGIKNGLKQEKSKLEITIKKNLEKDLADRLSSMEEELNEKSQQVKE